MPPGPPSTATSTKTIRCAAEASGDPKYYLSPPRTLPRGFGAADLAALTVWFLVSEGHRAVAVRLNGRMEGEQMGLTMGVPVAFFNDKQLRASFLGVARRAWTFYCKEGLLDSAVSIEKARRVLQKHPVALSTISNHEVQDWIDHRATVAVKSPIDILRSEDEAARQGRCTATQGHSQ